MEIRSLANTGFDTIFKAFSQAFADYEMQLNSEQLRTMLKRRGFVAELSFAAFDDDEIVAFTLNGIGKFGDSATAYDTGTGTVKERRGEGLATEIFSYSIPHLRAAGIGQYLLEVLQHNTGAVSIYRNLGFEVTREFNYAVQDNDLVGKAAEVAEDTYSLRNAGPEILNVAPVFWDFNPSWQNSNESILRTVDDFIFLGVYAGEELIGYGVFEPASGDITQIGVHKQHRRKGVGSMMLGEMTRLNRNKMIKALNTDISCNSVNGFLVARNLAPTGRQFEMVRNL